MEARSVQVVKLILMANNIAMKRNILVILIALMPIVASGQRDRQSVQQLITSYTSQLEQKKVKQWLLSWHYCNGSIEMIRMPDGSMCISKGSYYQVYLLYEDEDQGWIVKFDNCGPYQPVKMDGNALLDYYASNFERLMEEDVLPYKSASYTGDPELRKSVEPCFREFVFKQGENKRDLSYNLYHMSSSKEEPNKNYQHNSGLAVYTLDNMIGRWINENQGKFKRAK